MIKSIVFKKNYNNKLNCNYFTTIRRSGRFKVGEGVRILFNSQVYRVCSILRIRRFHVKDLNEYITLLDAGMEVYEMRDYLNSLYPGEKYFDLILLG